MKTMIAVLLLSSAAAFAQPSKNAEPTAKEEAAQDRARTVPGGASKGVKACHEDIERWCKTVVPGEGRVGACLKANKKKLSKKCRAWARHGGAGHEDEGYMEVDRSTGTSRAK